MGCSSCGTKALSNKNNSRVSIVHFSKVNPDPCDYTDERLQVFNDKLVWFKDKALYVKQNIKPALVNKYIGIVLTSMNSSNKCMYRDTLNRISELVDLIITLE